MPPKTRQDRGVVPQEQPGLNQEAPSSTEGAETVAEGGSDPITSSPAVGFTEGTVSELAGLVKVLLQSQAARDDRMEQVMVKQDQRWRNMQHQFQQIQHQVLEIQAGGDRRGSQTISPTLAERYLAARRDAQRSFGGRSQRGPITRAQSARADFNELPFADADVELAGEKRRKSKKERRKLKFEGSVESRQVEELPLPEGPLNMIIPEEIAELQRKDSTVQDWFQKVSEVDGVRNDIVSCLMEEKYILKKDPFDWLVSHWYADWLLADWVV
ncbi:hypothetical protein G5714_021853 [Onychostoma macrolepis]|uniref:Uncharacterized protein n=1 Tax=Onychostoma macrolepis TaxID=369639 RepID=A0A7J6BU47_9TELE|nr:hypothetical protein G5714_021853 [Onychostoma macrolepis]